MKIYESKKSPVASVKDSTTLSGNHARKSPMPHKACINFRIDALAFLTFLITAVSGMALMRIHPSENEQIIWGLSSFVWLHLHNLIGWIFVALVMIHLIMHRSWVASMLSRWLYSNHMTDANGGLIRINKL